MRSYDELEESFNTININNERLLLDCIDAKGFDFYRSGTSLEHHDLEIIENFLDYNNIQEYTIDIDYHKSSDDMYIDVKCNVGADLDIQPKVRVDAANPNYYAKENL